MTFVHAFNPTSIPLHRRWIHTSSPLPSSSSSLHLRRPLRNSIDYTIKQQRQRRKELQAFSTPKNETSNNNASLNPMEEKKEKEEEINSNSIPRLPDFQKWDSMLLPNVIAAVSLPNLPKMKIPPLPNINITMPKVDLDLDFNLSLDQNSDSLITDKFKADEKRTNGDKTEMKPTPTSTSTSRSTPIVEVISDQPQRFRNLKLKIPTVNMRDIPRPWTRYYDSSIDAIDKDAANANAKDGKKNDKEQVVIDVGAVLDLSDAQSERENRRPLDLFGVLPDLEFNLNLQFDAWWKNEKEQGLQSHEHSDSECESDSSKASSPPHKNTQRLLLDALTSSIYKVTGKDMYQFGDITRYFESCAKNSWNEIQMDARDLAQHLDHEMDEKIQEIRFTKGQIQDNVQNVTRTLIRKVASEEYQLSEITFLCKVLMALGADFAPMAGVLPVKLLLELFGHSIAFGLAERFFTAIITELDRRLEINEEVKALSALDESNKDVMDGVDIVDTSEVSSLSSSRKERGLDNYAPGDLTEQAILEFTGKESYKVGNIAEKQREKGIIERVDDDRTSIDVISELEECLKMERELVEKLNRVQTLTSKNSM
jgi:hypothetical protein